TQSRREAKRRRRGIATATKCAPDDADHVANFAAEMVRSGPALQNPKEGVGKQNNCTHDREGELKTGRKEFVRIPPEKKEGCRGEAVEHENFSFEKKAAEQNRTHHCSSHTRNVKARHRRIEKKRGDNNRGCPLARQSRDHCQHP